MRKKVLKFEIVVLAFFINACTWVYLGDIFDQTLYIVFRVLNQSITIIGIVYCTIKAFSSLDISKAKKILLVIAQLIGIFILWIIWCIIWFVFFSGGIEL